jgi:dihydroflavonol-4-reductase
LNLVTGATGILGSHVVLALLLDNKEVIACRRKNSDLGKVKQLFSYYTTNYDALFQKIKWVEVDICDIFSIEEALAGITNVYHCAGFVSFEKKDRKKLKEINEYGTKNVVDACLHKGIAALCFASSVATINNTDYHLPLTEDVFWKSSGKESDYAISKYNAEREVWRAMEEGLNAVIVNPGIILSPGFWTQSSSRLFDQCYRGNSFYTEGMAAYVVAMDVATIMIKLVESRQFDNRYIVVEGNYSYRSILSQVQTSFNKKAPKIRAGKTLLNLVKFFNGLFSFLIKKESKLTKAIIAAAFNKQVFSNQKVKNALSYELLPVNDAIKMICNFYLAEKSKSSSSL